MALLRKLVSRNTFALISTVWNALAVYIPLHFHWTAETIILVMAIGNAVIIWLGVESGNESPSKTEK